MLDARKEEAFCTILREELQLATGCTEPIAVAYCAARLRQVLGERPRRILAEVSGNILKNVKSVVVPNTGGRRGLPENPVRWAPKAPLGQRGPRKPGEKNNAPKRKLQEAGKKGDFGALLMHFWCRR